ncbi:MAG: UDP-N-acetylmuramate--L-alanine ligase [Planctomycetota bacterium]
MGERAHRPNHHALRSVDHLLGHRAYFVGIGGCGMSALVRLWRARGVIVLGSDRGPSEVTTALLHEGIAVTFDQDAGCLPDDLAVVVCSQAIGVDHPERLAAEQAGLPTLTYPEALGLTMAGRTGVAIAGTHGKSTTTAMLGVTLAQAGLDPSVIVGAACAQLAEDSAGGPGHRLGAPTVPAGDLRAEPGLLVAEACEYARSFHHLHPTMAAITSVEADHLDVYGSVDAVIDAFSEFTRLVPEASAGGRLLIAHDGAHRREVTAGARCEVRTIGYAPNADYHIETSRTGPPGRAATRVCVAVGRRRLGCFDLALPGEHMAFDAAVALVLATWCGADPDAACAALSTFRGVDRRMHLVGELDTGAGPPVRVYDDYGHHPTEIDATLRALREHERPQERAGRLICVFQPHQHSRTRFLLDEFAQSFAHADVVIVPHIYFVRDTEIEKSRVSAADLVDRLRARDVSAMHLYPFEAIVDHLRHTVHPGDVVVVMGAGPVWQVGRDLLAGDPPARRASA